MFPPCHPRPTTSHAPRHHAHAHLQTPTHADARRRTPTHACGHRCTPTHAYGRRRTPTHAWPNAAAMRQALGMQEKAAAMQADYNPPAPWGGPGTHRATGHREGTAKAPRGHRQGHRDRHRERHRRKHHEGTARATPEGRRNADKRPRGASPKRFGGPRRSLMLRWGLLRASKGIKGH